MVSTHKQRAGCGAAHYSFCPDADNTDVYLLSDNLSGEELKLPAYLGPSVTASAAAALAAEESRGEALFAAAR